MPRFRSTVVTRFIETIQAANLGLGSVNRYVRSFDQVRDRPSCDVTAGAELGENLSAEMIDGGLRVVVRLYARRTNDRKADEEQFDDLIDAVKDAIRANYRLGGAVTMVLWKETLTDMGHLSQQGQPSLAEIHFDVTWEQEG